MSDAVIHPAAPPAAAAPGSATRPTYRPDIDGLRAIAVIAVFLNHIDKALLPSGHLGVDIFFVISGFVITSSLINHRPEGFGSFLAGFYARRFRRLLPALLAFVAVASVLICLVNPKPDASIRAGIAAVFGVSNLYFLSQQTNYFGSDADLNIFTHTWSLGVEEQFYLLFPLLVWLMGLPGRPGRGPAVRLALVLIPLLLASWLFYRSASGSDQDAAFYLMPARFWELASGSLCFLAATFIVPGRWRRFRYPLLVLLLMLVCLALKMEVGFLSSYRLTTVVVALTVLLLLSLHPGALAWRLLSARPLVALGLMSYSLYLWHWGFLCLARWSFGVNRFTLPVIVGASLVVSFLSYRFIETPFRHSVPRFRSAVVLASGFGASAVTAAWLLVLSGLQEKFFLTANNPLDRFEEVDGVAIYDHCNFFFGHIRFDPLTAREHCTFLPVAHRSAAVSTSPSRQRRHLYFLGNSHASQLTGLIARIRDLGLYDQTLLVTGAIKNPPLPKALMNPPWNAEPWTQKGIATQNDIAEHIFSTARPGDVIILGNDLLGFTRIPGDVLRPEAATSKALDVWLRQLSAFAARAEKRGLSVIVLKNVPFFKPLQADLNPDLCRATWFRPVAPTSCHQSAERDVILATMAPVNTALAQLADQHANLHLYDPTEPVCPGRICLNRNADGRLYSDNKHLNNRGSLLLVPSFIEFLRARGLQ